MDTAQECAAKYGGRMIDEELFIPMVTLIFGYFLGWVFAHSTVATECGKLGSFYVNEKIYECKIKAEGK